MAGDKGKQSLSDFSPSYRKQIERYQAKHPGTSIEASKKGIYDERISRAAAKNPDISLAQARGHAKEVKAREGASKVELQQAALREKASQLRLQEKLGKAPEPEKLKEAQKILRKMQREAKRMLGLEGQTVGGPSSLEWTKWSQEQKQRELTAGTLLGTVDPRQDAKARKILEKMKDETEKMWTMKTRRPGTVGYHKAQDRLASLYDKLEKLGFVHRTGDITAGDVGYH